MMATVAQNLQKLVTAKTNIRNAILQMGGTCPSSHGFEEFDDDILTINSVPSLSASSTTLTARALGGKINSGTDDAKTKVGFISIKANDLYNFGADAVNYYKANYNIELTANLTISASKYSSSSVSLLGMNSWISMVFSTTSEEDAIDSNYVVHSYTSPYVTTAKTLVSTNISATVPFISGTGTFGICVILRSASKSDKATITIQLSNINVALVHK